MVNKRELSLCRYIFKFEINKSRVLSLPSTFYVQKTTHVAEWKWTLPATKHNNTTVYINQICRNENYESSISL